MHRPHRLLALTIRWRLLAAVLGILAGASSAAAQSGEPLVVPRLIDINVERVELDRADLSLRMAARSTRTATIRRLSFPEATLDGVPVWIEPLDVQWHVEANRDSILPRLLQVRLYTRDVMKGLDLRALAARGSARVRAVAEIDAELPWLARLLLRGSTRTMMLDMEVDVPLYAKGGVAASMATLAATVIDTGRTILAPRLAGATAVDQQLLARYRDATAEISIAYAVEGDGARRATRTRGLGFRAAPGVLCTSREVIEPWRFDLRASTALLHGRSRVVVEHASMLTAGSGSSERRIDTRQLQQALPEPSSRKVYVWLNGTPRQIALAQRDHQANVICLRLEDGIAPASATLSPTPAPGPLAAFAVQGDTLAVVRARATPGDRGLLRLDPPIARSASGSPIVSASGVSGVVLSPSAAATLDDLRRAMARAVPTSSTAGAGGSRQSPD